MPRDCVNPDAAQVGRPDLFLFRACGNLKHQLSRASRILCRSCRLLVSGYFMVIARKEDRAQIEVKTRLVARYNARSAEKHGLRYGKGSFVRTRIPTSLNPCATRTTSLSGSCHEPRRANIFLRARNVDVIVYRRSR